MTEKTDTAAETADVVRQWVPAEAEREKEGHNGGSILVGSSMSKDCSSQHVAIAVNGACVALSVDGARRISRQLAEWAEAAAEHNAARNPTILKYIVKTQVEQAEARLAPSPAVKKRRHK